MVRMYFFILKHIRHAEVSSANGPINSWQWKFKWRMKSLGVRSLEDLYGLVIQKTLPWVWHRKTNLDLFFAEFARRLHWQRRLHVRQRDVWPPHRLRHQELVVTSPGRDRPFGGMDGLWSILQPQGHSGVPSSQKSHGESTMERFNHVTLISV